MVPASSHKISRVSWYLIWKIADFEYKTFTFYGLVSQLILLSNNFLDLLITRIFWSHFARHYLGNHYLFSFPLATKMFQFARFASKETSSLNVTALPVTGYPIRKSPDHSFLTEAYRILLRPSSPINPKVSTIHSL